MNLIKLSLSKIKKKINVKIIEKNLIKYHLIYKK